MRRKVIAGNWKMYKSQGEAKTFAIEFKDLVTDIKDREIVICPPSVHISTLVEAFAGSPVKIGGQNLFWEDEGAYTAEISGPMLKSVGASHVIIGHSERRQYFNETDETVNKRLFAALKSGLMPIVCIGETLKQRESGSTFNVIDTQVKNGLKGLAGGDVFRLVVAYEPVWAIGTGKTATPEIAQEVHAYIRSILSDMFGSGASGSIPVLYGGSVKPDNIDVLMAQKDIDGALVGGASLKVDSFERIVKYRS
jgi:triosephosphate isomerase (TIM)